jgi:small subunit ribosomal protein S20
LFFRLCRVGKLLFKEDFVLANHKSALKRIRSSARKRMKNRIYMSRTRTAVKKAREALSNSKDVQATIEQVRQAVSQLDKAASKGIIHKNAAARRKSRLMKKLAALQSPAVQSK